MKLSELKKIVSGYIYSPYEASIGLDGTFTMQELLDIIKYMEEYKDGDENL